MYQKALATVATLVALVCPMVALAQPDPRALVDVVKYRDGSSCVDLHLRLPGQKSPEVLRTVCHGWTTFSCAGNLYVEVHPVVQATAVVLFPAERKKLDLTAAIDRQVKQRWPGYELEHLDFAKPKCRGTTIDIAFEGSRVPINNGGGYGLKGAIRVEGSAAAKLTREPAEPF